MQLHGGLRLALLLGRQLCQAFVEALQFAGQLPPFFAQLFQCIAFKLQGALGGADIQRLVLLDGRVFGGAAQWAGAAGLQVCAVGFQGLDALLLLKQLFLVTHLLLQVPVGLAALRHLGGTGVLAGLRGQPLGVQAVLLAGQLFLLLL